jgi:selenium-binding protein 1
MGLASLAVLAGCPSGDREQFAYVNTVAEGGANDQALVIDVDKDSDTFGKIVKAIDLGSKNNEPHHAGINVSRTAVYMMGLFLPGRVWKLDIAADPASPTLKTVVNDASMEVQANNPDEFVALADGRYMISFMGSAAATAPGAIAIFGADDKMVKKFEPTGTATSTFNPHGFDVRTDVKRMANGSFILPADAAGLDGTGIGDTFRGALTVWEFDAVANTASIKNTYDLSGGNPMKTGIMDVKMIPNDAKGRCFATNMLAGELWVATTVEPFEAKAVVTGLVFPQLLQVTADGKTLFLSTFEDNKVHKYDITNPDAPVETGVVTGPEGTLVGKGAHSIRLSTDEERLYVSSYFVKLKDDTASIPGNDQTNTADFSGARMFWAINTKDMSVIPELTIDMAGASLSLADGSMLSGGPFGPHGIVLDQ